MLRRKVEAIGITVHTSTAMASLTPGDDGRVSQVELADGGSLDTDLVVFAAGVRPRDELARAAGLPIGPRGGVVVDSACRTPDPSIWAIGECACIEGGVHGLVAPGYAMAEIAADRLCGGLTSFGDADLSTQLKLLGVEVASFGDAHSISPNALDVVYTDPVAGVYKKLVLSDDARTLLGGVLVGDSSAYPLLRGAVGGPLPGAPEALLMGAGGEIAGPVGSVPVCSCTGVTADTVNAAIHDEGCLDVPALKACTRAGTGCGSCVPLLKQMLAKAGVVQNRGLLRTFSAIVEVGLVRHRPGQGDHDLQRPDRRAWSRPRVRHLQTGGGEHPGRPRPRARAGRGAGGPAGHQRSFPGQSSAQRHLFGCSANSRWRGCHRTN